VLPASRHAELMSLAVKHAILQRGVGHLILPNEVQGLPVDEATLASGPEGRLTPLAIAPPDETVLEMLARLRASKRPVIIVGHGARFDMDDVLALAERLNAPLLTTFKAKGLVTDDHPLGCGVLGHSGTPIASWFMNEADLLLVFGASFSDHTGSTPFQPTIQVDTDPMALGKTHPIDVPVGGDIGVTARRLLGAIGDEVQTDDQRPQIAERWDLWQTEKASRALDDRGRGIAGAALNRHVSDDAVMTVDVGNNTYSFGRYFECTRQSVLMSGYLGSIGFAYPAAIGAWAAAPDRPIVAIAGGREIRHADQSHHREQLGVGPDLVRATRKRDADLVDLATKPQLRHLRRELRRIRSARRKRGRDGRRAQRRLRPRRASPGRRRERPLTRLSCRRYWLLGALLASLLGAPRRRRS